VPRPHVAALLVLSSSLFAMTACGGSAVPTHIPNISGDYSGMVNDTQGGSGTLAQHGSSAGGAFTIAQATQTLTANFSLTMVSSNSFNGSVVIDYPSGGPTCTFHTTGTYHDNGSSSAGINGSYRAVTNCSGDTGTYSLAQQCTDTITSVDRRRPMGFPIPC
jgi:hypothetical protein